MGDRCPTIKMGDLFVFKGTMQLIRVSRVTRRRVYYDGEMFAGFLPRETFEQRTWRIFVYRRKA